jgi:hypothetical protein
VEEREKQQEEDMQRILQDPRMQASLKRVMADLRVGKFKEKAKGKKKEG